MSMETNVNLCCEDCGNVTQRFEDQQTLDELIGGNKHDKNISGISVTHCTSFEITWIDL